MKLFYKLAMVVTVSVALVLSLAASPKKAASQDRVVPATQLKFADTPQAGISRAVLWGDPAKGPYGAITRFKKGTTVPWHTHSHDIRAVVISGTLIYNSGSGEQRLGPGSFLQERSTIKHTTAAGADSDLEFFEENTGPFDIKMSK
jgi:quercetin dioxygenase-like cupin family protein